jgi:predicted phage terminase large subunit-like protein
VLAKRRLIAFTQRINPRYHAGWVHNDIARRLEKFSQDVADGLSPRLMILMPPRAGKSELASRMFPAWHLGHYPDHEMISCGYNVSLAMSFSRKVKEAMDDPAYQSVFATRLNPEFKSNEEWGLANGRGGYVAAGVGGGINGKGAHILLIDDPIKNAEEADSADNREKLWDWYGSTAYTRLAPGGGVLVIQTWWHDDDLAGKLQTAMASDPEADQFVVVKYPAIAEHDEYLDDDTDLIVYDAPPTNGRLLRLKGAPLHPERFDLQKLNRIKKTIPPRFWAALYQQNPVPDDGAYFTKSQFKSGPLPPLRRSNVFVAFDFAISEKKQNDYTVGVVGLQDEHDVLHVAEVLRFKSGDGMFIVESILNLCQKWYSSNLVLGFEDGQIFRAIESLLKKRMRERKFYPATQLLKPITDKMARARPLQGRMQQGMVSFADGATWFEAARAEMLRFPAGVHDDQVDALAWMTTMAVGREPPRVQQVKAPKSWKDKLKTIGGTTSHMSA